MRRILRHVIPVDDQWHLFAVNPQIRYHVESRRSGVVDLWLDVNDDPYTMRRLCWFRAYGTGHELPVGPRWIGTVLDHGFVWHILATIADPTESNDA